MFPQDATSSPEQLLWARVGRGVLLGMALFTLIGFAIATLGYPSMSLAGAVGIGLFVGFWSGPFFGSAGAVGYHELQVARATQLSVLQPLRAPHVAKPLPIHAQAA